MPYTLVWSNGTECVSAEYSTFDEALAQGKDDGLRPGGPEIKHILDPDNIVVAAWTPEVNGVQYVLSDIFLAAYAKKLRQDEISQGVQ